MANSKIIETAERLLMHGRDTLGSAERSVIARLHTRHPIAKDEVAAYEGALSVGQRLADRVAAFGGSWTFIILFGVVLVLWVSLNTIVLATRAFDPYPFVFLNLILSMIAALQAPVIMMSQNRVAVKDRLDAAHDYEVNLKAELEIMALHEKLDQLRTEHLAALMTAQQEQLRLLQSLVSARPG